MKKFVFLWLTLFLCVSAGCVFTGCGGKEEGERRDLEFSVVAEKEIPATLKTMIENKKEKPFRFTYREGDLLYFTEGYGIQPTGGYSIQVDEVYKQGNAIYCRTTLHGPSPEDEPATTSTYPYIVFVTEYQSEPTIFK